MYVDNSASSTVDHGGDSCIRTFLSLAPELCFGSFKWNKLSCVMYVDIFSTDRLHVHVHILSVLSTHIILHFLSS